MNKHYDKLTLLAAVGVLVAGAVLYTMQSGPDAKNGKPMGSGEYAPVAVTAMEINTVEWSKPEPQQPSGFEYDVFTPYEIYIKPRTGEFTQDRPGGGPQCEWDAMLLSIERVPYRIQLEGFIEEGEGSVLFLLYDLERKQKVRARNGQESTAAAAAEFKVLDAEVELVVGPDGSRTRIAKATILDERTNEQKVLIHRELLYENAVTILVGSTEDASFQAELSEVGDQFTTQYGTYTLQEINLEDLTITVEKAATDDCEAEVNTLSQQVIEAEEPTNVEDVEDAQPSSAGSAFEALFENL